MFALPDGSVLVADTYNGAVRRYDPLTAAVSTVADGLAEPSDIVLTADRRRPRGRVRRAPARPRSRRAPSPRPVATVAGERHRTERPPSMLAPGEVTLDVIFSPAPGQKLDESFGPSTRLEVSASPPELLLDGAGVTTDLSRRLVVNARRRGRRPAGRRAGGHLRRRRRVPRLPPHPAGLGRPDRGSTADGAARLPLVLRGLDEG